MAANVLVAVERPAPFKLERFFERYEFNAPHLLCCSDCEPVMMSDLLALADADAKARWEGLRLSYTDTAGLPALRQAVSEILYGGALSPSQLLVCAPEEGVYITMRALLRPGDRVVCAFPAYQSLYELALTAGCTLDFWEPKWDGPSGAPRFDVSELESLVAGGGVTGDGAGDKKPPARLVVVNFPHNPTGASVPVEDQLRIVAACRAAGTHLFSDEMYWRLEPDESSRLPPAAALYERAVTLCGLSKSWGLPGLRVGWIATKDQALLARAAQYKDFTTICSSAPSEVLALIAVRATKELTSRARGIVAANTELAAALFGRWGHLLDWAPADAGPICFPRVKLSEAARLTGGALASIDAFCQAAVDEAGVLLLPASVFDHPASTDRGHFRLGLGRVSTPEALRHFEAWLVKRFGPPPPQVPSA